MKIALSNKEIAEINKVLIAKENNISSAELYIDYLENHYNDIKNIKASYVDEFLKVLDIDKDDEEFLEMDSNSNIMKIDELDINVYKNNPYYKNVKFSNVKEKKWTLCNLFYNKYEAFVYDELIIGEKYYK